jgi:hypothetical protein
MFLRPAACARERVRTLECRDDPLGRAALSHGFERFRIGRMLVTHAPEALELAVLRADTRVVQARGDRVCLLDLAMLVLKNDRVAALQHPCATETERGGIVAESGPATARLHAEQLDTAVREERMEQADRVRAPAHAGDRDIGQPARLLEHLRTCLAPDDRLQLANQPRVRMRADCGTEQVVRAIRIRYPVAQRLVDRGTQCAIAAGHGNDRRTQ